MLDILRAYIGTAKPLLVTTPQLQVLVYVTQVNDKPSACFSGYYIDDTGAQRHKTFSLDAQSKLANLVSSISENDIQLYPQ